MGIGIPTELNTVTRVDQIIDSIEFKNTVSARIGISIPVLNEIHVGLELQFFCSTLEAANYQATYPKTDAEGTNYWRNIIGSDVSNDFSYLSIGFPIQYKRSWKDEIGIPFSIFRKEFKMVLLPEIGIMAEIPLTTISSYNQGEFDYQGYYPGLNWLARNVEEEQLIDNQPVANQADVSLRPLLIHARVNPIALRWKGKKLKHSVDFYMSYLLNPSLSLGETEFLSENSDAVNSLVEFISFRYLNIGVQYSFKLPSIKSRVLREKCN